MADAGSSPVARAEARTLGAARYGCYVALGDSFSAGTGVRREALWPNHLAGHMRLRNRDLVHRNLALEGARSAQVLERVPAALQLEPDLVTVVCGLNDALFSVRVDALSYARNLAATFRALERALPSVRILTATVPQRWGHLRPRVAERLERGAQRLNRTTRSLAAAYGIACVEIADHPGAAEAENFASDGLHPSAAGHARVALEFIRVLETGTEK